jgi:chaperonin GroES
MEQPPMPPMMPQNPQMGMQPPDVEGQLQQLAQQEQALQVIVAAENHNLAEDIKDEGLLREIAQEISNGFDDDDASRADWLEQHTFWLSLYMQNDYAENSDQERDWGATESLPILTEACDQFQTRTYKTFFPQDSFVSAIPMRKKKEDRDDMEARAKRIGDHMSYQLGFKDKSYKQDKDALFLGVAVHGSFFTKTYFNDNKMAPTVDNVRPTDLVVNYNVGPARIEDLRRKTHVIYSTVGETQDKVNMGFFSQPASPAQAMQGENPYNVKVDEISGLSRSGTSRIKRDAPAVLYEQHFYLDLDGTGVYKPYIGTICAASKKLLRLVVGYHADPLGNPLKDYEQEQYFTHYKYKNNPDGFYGLGLGHSIGDLNSACNIMLRQTMDAGTLANDGNMSGFISERLGIDEEEMSLIIGKFKKIPDTVGDIQNGIFQFKFPGPNVALIQLMEAMDIRAQRLGSTTEATTGTPEHVEQPTTYLAQIEQALEAFSSVQMRLAASLGDELQKVYHLNQRYLPLVDYFVVNDEPDQITRADYADDMLIQPVFDPKFATQQQKTARAQAELNATLQNPVNQGRPAVYDAAFKRYLTALDVDNIDELIPPAPQVENFDDQVTENMFFLMPQEARPLFDVFPSQNHQQHLMLMQQFMAQYAQMLDPEQQQVVQKHYQKHTAYLYGEMNGIIPPNQIPDAPLAAQPGNQMANGSAIAQIPPSQAAGLASFTGEPLPVGIGNIGDGMGAGSSGNKPPM